MYLLRVLRFVLGLLSRMPSVFRATRTFCDRVAKQPCSIRGVALAADPHEWMSMDCVLTEGSVDVVYSGRGTFKRANHPFRSVSRFFRRLAGGSESCLALATVRVGDSRLMRK